MKPDNHFARAPSWGFMLHRVKDLSPKQRQAAEILPGHPVSEDEAVSIRSLDASRIIPSKLAPGKRVDALRALTERLAGAEIDPEKEESAVIEAMRSSRRNYGPLG